MAAEHQKIKPWAASVLQQNAQCWRRRVHLKRGN